MTPDARIHRLVTRLDRLAQVSEDDEVQWTGPATEAAIATVEAALGVHISGSFRDFLLKAGGGGLDTFSISSVPASAPLGGLGTVHGDTLHYRAGGWTTPLPPHLVVIQRSPDDNEPFCLDTSRIHAGENPVVLFYHQARGGGTDRIAGSFIDFFEAYAAPYLENMQGNIDP